MLFSDHALSFRLEAAEGYACKTICDAFNCVARPGLPWPDQMARVRGCFSPIHKGCDLQVLQSEQTISGLGSLAARPGGNVSLTLPPV